MRGEKNKQPEIFSYLPVEDRIPKKHPLRKIKEYVDTILEKLSDEFDNMYSNIGRPSIPPEALLKGLVLQVLYTIRSERQLMEQIKYNWLYRWFVGLGMDEKVWDPTVFCKNRDRLLEGAIAQKFFNIVKNEAKLQKLISKDHFTVDGTLIEAWAGHKSFKKKDVESGDENDDDGTGRNPDRDFHGEKRTNDTHKSTTDPDARIYRKGKGKESKLAYMGHVLMENRNGLVVDAELTLCSGTAERDTAFKMAKKIPGKHRKTIGADKNYDTQDFTNKLKSQKITPHVAQKTHCKSGIDGRITHHSGYEISQRKRKRVEEIFGWLKTVGGLRKTKFRGRDKVGWMYLFSLSVYNLVRMKNLVEENG